MVLALFLLISATAASEYIRPSTRKNLDFSRPSKSSSHPQQVILSFLFTLVSVPLIRLC